MTTSPLRITRVQAWHVRVPYLGTMRSSRGSLDAGDKVVLCLTAVDGSFGLGEASIIFPARDGESADSIFRRVKKVIGPRLLGRDGMATAPILHDLSLLSSEKYAFPSSLCAVDMALHDLKARHLGIPVTELIGGMSRSRFLLSRSMSMNDEEKGIASALKLAEQGYRLITLKGSSDWRRDIRHTLAIRQALPAEVRLEIDPNQAWQPKAALAVDHALQGCDLECIEQPCAWWDLEGMQHVTQQAHAPIAADESVLSPADVMRVARMRAADVITIKLAKSGGIRKAAAMLEIAEAAGLQCNLGSKHTLGVGTAALLHFAAAYPGVGDFIGYGSALERFAGDVIRERIAIDSGIAYLPQGPGLGVTLDEEALQGFSVQAVDLRPTA